MEGGCGTLTRAKPESIRAGLGKASRTFGDVTVSAHAAAFPGPAGVSLAPGCQRTERPDCSSLYPQDQTVAHSPSVPNRGARRGDRGGGSGALPPGRSPPPVSALFVQRSRPDARSEGADSSDASRVSTC